MNLVNRVFFFSFLNFLATMLLNCQRGRGVPESGKASKPEEPARKPQTVREYHRAHEAEILPHGRRGLYLQDYRHFSLDQMTIFVIVCKLKIKI